MGKLLLPVAMAPRWLVFLAHSRVLAGLSVSQQLVSPSVLQLFSLQKLTSVSLTLDTNLAGFPSTPFPESWFWWEPEPGLGY